MFTTLMMQRSGSNCGAPQEEVLTGNIQFTGSAQRGSQTDL